MRNVKYILLWFLTVALLCITSEDVLAETGHARQGSGDGGAVSFRINNVQISLYPEQLSNMPEADPARIVVELRAVHSDTPVLDADLLILLRKSSRKMDKAKSGRSAPSAALQANEEISELDFGDLGAETDPVIDLTDFTALRPEKKAGVFSADAAFDGYGNYEYTLAVKSLGGRAFPEPLVYGGIMAWREESRSSLLRIIFLIVLVITSGIASLWIVCRRISLNLPAGHSLNLLEIPAIRRFMRSAWFQPMFQIPTALFFALIIYFGLTDIQVGDRNIATILMWTIWWAAIIFTFVFVGRIWCMMCPYGAIQDWIGRIFSLGRSFPRPLRNICLSTFLFLLITWWDTWSGIVNKPALTAWLLIGFFVIAVGTSLFFKGRTFCRYICPIGGLIGIYSMFSPIELRNKCLEVCRKDNVKGCIRGTKQSYSCPMFETPMTMDRNNYCNFCSECIKGCAEDNIVIRFRRFATDLWVSARGHMDEAYLALALTGLTVIVTAEMVEPWHGWMDSFGKLMPFGLLGIRSHELQENLSFTVLLVIGSMIVPALLLFVASLIVKWTAGTDSPVKVKKTFVQFAYMFIPVGLAMHLSHNIAHLFKEGPLVIPAARRVLIEYLGWHMRTPDWNVVPLIGNESIFWLQMLILLVLQLFSLYAGYRIAVRHFGSGALKAFVPMALLVVGFTVVNAFVLGQPMALRHTH